MFKNEYTLTVDLKKKMTAITPKFVKYDNATLVFKIFDNGKLYDLTDFTRAEVSHKRPDGKVVLGVGSIETLSNGEFAVRYNYLGSEMNKAGFVETSLSIFSADKKVSILPFKVEIISDNRDGSVEDSEEEVGILQELIAQVSRVLVEANQAVDSANQAVLSANQAIVDAEAAVVLATTSATLANDAADSANTKAQLADVAATNANDKAALADEKALLAQAAADNANNAILGIDEAKNNANLAATNANNAATNATNATANANTAITATELATTKANTATTNAIAATTNANQVALDTLLAKNAAQIATNNANTATTNANDAVASVNIAKTNAELATSNANSSAANADLSAQSANSAATNAQMIADNTVSVGDFVLGNLYKKNNLVLNNGSTWIALADTQNNPLPILPLRENAWWRLVAQRGVDGTGSVVSVNNISPDVNGNVTLDLGDSITMVDGFSPDPSGNVTTHTNKAVLDALTDDLGQLKYKGIAVGSVSSVNGQTGAIVGLETVVGSNAKLDTKVDKVVGKQFSTEDYTTVEKDKLTGVEDGAQVNTVLSVNGQVGNVIGLETTVGVDNKLSNKVDKEIGKQLSTEDYTSIEKAKLAGIENNANNYTHPLTHPPSIIEQDINNRFVTDIEKLKLAGIETGAQVNTITSVNGATGDITGLATDTSVDNKIGILSTDISNKIGVLNDELNEKVSKGELGINAKDYGALGDGMSDDIIALENAASAAIGGVLILPKGDYFITSTLEIPENTTVLAYGSKIFNKNKHMALLNIKNSTKIYGLALEGYGNSSFDENGIAINIKGINSANYLKDITLEDCTINGFSAYGIFGEFVENVNINRCTVSNIGYGGIMFLSATNVNVVKSDIKGISPGVSSNAYNIAFTRTSVSDSLVDYPRSKSCTVENCNIEDNNIWEGLDTHGGENIRFINNTIKNCVAPIMIGGSGNLISPIYCEAIGNTIYGKNTKSYPGIVVKGCPNGSLIPHSYAESCKVVRNTLIACGVEDTNSNGSIMLEETRNIIVSENIIENSFGNAINLYIHNESFVVSSNTIIDPQSQSIVTVSGIIIREGHAKGFIGSNSLLKLNASLNTFVSERGIFIAVSDGVDIVLGSNFINFKDPLVGTYGQHVKHSALGVGISDYVGIGSPEGVILASVGSTYRNVNGSALTTIYVKTSGEGKTGWTAK